MNGPTVSRCDSFIRCHGHWLWVVRSTGSWPSFTYHNYTVDTVTVDVVFLLSYLARKIHLIWCKRKPLYFLLTYILNSWEKTNVHVTSTTAGLIYLHHCTLIRNNSSDIRACATFKTVHLQTLYYLHSLLSYYQLPRDFLLTRQQSSHTSTISAESAFSHSSPAIWNTLPFSVTSATLYHLFQISY